MHFDLVSCLSLRFSSSEKEGQSSVYKAMYLLVFVFLFSENSGSYDSTPNAFIFPLGNKEGLAPFKSMVTEASRAIYRGQRLVQHLVAGMTFTLLIMPPAIALHTQGLATPTLSQVEYMTRTQSWLGLTTSHLMTWKYST